MISLVSIVNDATMAENRLLRGLARQTVPHQLIAVDNSDRRFPGATAALNWGAERATGDWVVFLHQDVELLSADWLQVAEETLNRLPSAGWSGVVGRTKAGRWRGILRDRAMVFGDPFDAPLEVQTLDEVVLIHRKKGQAARYFDEGVPGWHAYGVDACCEALRLGARNYVIPLPIWHDSRSTNVAGLAASHRYVWRKHRSKFRRIYTTCGVLPHPYGWSGSYKVATLLRRLAERRYSGWSRLSGDRNDFRLTPWEILDSLTQYEKIIECFHAFASFTRLDGVGFVDRPRVQREVRHYYRGLDFRDRSGDCLVIAPDLATQVSRPEDLPSGSQRLIVCIYLDDPQACPDRWQRLIGRPFRCVLAMEQDETRWAILEVFNQNTKN